MSSPSASSATLSLESIDDDCGTPLSSSSDIKSDDYDLPPTNFLPCFGPNRILVTLNSEPSAVGITTPLMEAIRAGLSENVKILLEAGANPNGIPIEEMKAYSAFFLRFRPAIPPMVDIYGDVASWETLLKSMDSPQISVLTAEEVEDRCWDGMAPFWCEEGFTPADFFHHGESMPSLVEAARSCSITVFDQLLDAGADASFWIPSNIFGPNPPTESSLSVSSPLHAALQGKSITMLKHLLKLGFDPNVMPLANPTRCFTPLMATVIYQKKFNREAFDILCDCPNINFELRTPVYGVHILHFAVASMDYHMLKHIASKTPLKKAGVTALGHTLLHIACMSANALGVHRHSELIYKSIHETRDLNARNDHNANDPPDSVIVIEFDKERDMAHQTAVVKYLWDNGICDLDTKDVHGNTALHYLVGCREVNEELLTWWLEKPGVAAIWRESDNAYGSTPEDLFYDGKIATRDGNGWRPWFSRYRSEERARRKENIWKYLLRINNTERDGRTSGSRGT